jgi:hypothetical protein
MRKFIILPFQFAPFGQAFRYEKKWWLKTPHTGLSAYQLRGYSSEVDDCWGLVILDTKTIIPSQHLVAIEDGFLAKLILKENSLDEIDA